MCLKAYDLKMSKNALKKNGKEFYDFCQQSTPVAVRILNVFRNAIGFSKRRINTIGDDIYKIYFTSRGWAGG